MLFPFLPSPRRSGRALLLAALTLAALPGCGDESSGLAPPSAGVDPYYNDNLSRQAGELHLLKNMASVSWMWFTSYIFTKTKGTFTTANGTTGTFAWDTGTNSNFRTTRLSFPRPVTVNAQKHLNVALNADVSKLFEALSPSAQPAIGAAHAGPRETLSDGFKAMFSMVSAESALQW
jgi:hypothetical protein